MGKKFKNDKNQKKTAPTLVDKVRPPLWKRILKWVGIVIGGFFLLLAVIFVFRDPIIGFSIEKIGSMATGVNLELGSFRSTLDGKMILRNFKLANPPGYNSPTAVEFELISVDVDMTTLFSRLFVIEDITVRGVNVDLEGKGTSGNIAEIQQNVEKFFGLDQIRQDEPDAEIPDDAVEVKDNSDTEQSVLIRLITLEGNSLTVASATVGANVPIPIVNLTMTDVGGEGKSWSDVFTELFDKIYGLVSGPLQSLGGYVYDAGKSTVGAVGSVGKSTVDTVGNVGKSAAGAAVSVGNAVMETVKSVAK